MNSEILYYKDVEYRGDGYLYCPRSLIENLNIRFREHGDDSLCLVPVTEAHRVYPLEKKSDRTDWWDSLVQQSEFVNQNSKYPILMKLPSGNDYLYTKRYVHSFADWLYSIKSDSVSYDRFLRGLIISNPVWEIETNKAMNLAGIIVTPQASEYISPITEQTLQLQEDALTATEEGYLEPSKELFPTRRSLMKHQLPVSQVLGWRGRGLLADDVGSGKSSMFLNGFFSHLQYLLKEGYYSDIDQGWPLVIVTKVSLLEPTQRECEVWLEGVKTTIVRGNKAQDIDDDVQIIICPGTSLDKQLSNIIAMEPKGVVYDEAHMYKNLNTNRGEAAKILSEYIKENNEYPYIVCATATPMPNRTNELWAPLVITGMSNAIVDHVYDNMKVPNTVKITNPRDRSTYFKKVDDQMAFELYFCGGKNSHYGWEAKGATNKEELAVLLRENGMIRRRKSEFMTPLPPLKQKFIYCEFSEEDKAIYNKAQDNFREHLVLKLREEAKEKGWSKQKLRYEIQEKLLKANNSEAIMKMSELRQLVGLMKIDHTVDWINRYFEGDPLVVGTNTNNKKLIVFSHHKEAQKRLVEHPDLQKHGVLYISAGTKKINDIIDEFQDPDSGKNLIVLYSNATDGLTLTAAHAVFVLEIPFVPSTLIQMAGRCWARYSEQYAPHEATLYLSTSNTWIDKYLEDMVKEKSILAKTIIDGEKVIEELNDIDSEETEQYNSSADILKQLIKKRE